MQDRLLGCYSHPVFRQFKFLVYNKTKSSEHRFMHRVFETFRQPQTNISKARCVSGIMVENALKEVHNHEDIVIGWGDWGRHPNALRCGVGPTPGIGIRRRFDSVFNTKTVAEHYTSKECPNCKDRSLQKTTLNSITRHHLLRCTNDTCCSRWWNRNVAGAFNILTRLLDGQTLSGNETTGDGFRR